MIEEICNVTHAYQRQIEYDDQLLIELTYEQPWPWIGKHDTFSCGVYYQCQSSLAATTSQKVTFPLLQNPSLWKQKKLMPFQYVAVKEAQVFY